MNVVAFLPGSSPRGMVAAWPHVAGRTRGSLWELAAGTPAMAPGSGWIYGILVTLPDPRALAVLDRTFGVLEGSAARKKVDVRVGLRSERAWAWWTENPRARGGRVLADGHWRPVRRRG